MYAMRSHRSDTYTCRGTLTDTQTQTDRQTDTDGQTDRHRWTDRQTQTDRQTHRQTDTQTLTDTQTDTDRQTDTHIDRHAVPMAQWAKPLLVGHCVCWPDGLRTLAYMGTNPGLDTIRLTIVKCNRN